MDFPAPIRTSIPAHPSNYRKGRVENILWIVIHTAETSEGDTPAEGVGRWFAQDHGPGRASSTHAGVDMDSVCTYLDDGDTPAAAPGLNRAGWHLEITGRAGQTVGQWADVPSIRTLEIAAIVCAEKAGEHDIPARWLTDEELASGNVKGFTRHDQGTRVFKVAGGHADPGPNFPAVYFMARVQSHMAAQRKRGLYLTEDGVLDEGTRRSVQRMLRVNPDGEWGPKTWTALQAWAGLRGKDLDGIPGPVTTRAVARKVGRPDLAESPWSHAWTTKPTALTRAIETYYNRAVRNGTAHWI